MIAVPVVQLQAYLHELIEANRRCQELMHWVPKDVKQVITGSMAARQAVIAKLEAMILEALDSDDEYGDDEE